MGTFFLVATPIGNLDDLSPRGVQILSQVNLILAEDTRHTGQLLKNLNITTPLLSYYEQNEHQRIPEILAKLADSDVALVSDAGTPTISDPGFKLVRAVTEAKIDVISIPGANAALTALTVSGLPTDRFTYLGFLPKKDSHKAHVLEEVKDLHTTLVIYESPFRVVKTLELLKTVLGNRRVSVSRELTKIHEQTVRGTIEEVIPLINPKGEFVIVVGSKEVG